MNCASSGSKLNREAHASSSSTTSPACARSLTGVLRDEGYTVEAVASGEACLDRVTRGPVDLIVLDVWLPGMDGLATLARLRERQVDAQVVLISGHGNIESAVRAIKMGAFDFVEKPLSLEKTVLVVRNALRQRRLEAENRALRARVDRTPDDGRRELRHAAAARAGRDGGADQRPRADLRRERHRQGARRADDPRPEPPAQRRRSSRSTARRSPRS